MQLLESSMQVVECHSPPCRILPACKLKSIFVEATQAFIQSLAAYHLSDLLVHERDGLVRILNIQ
ncbi:hypothetical protein RS130_20175 [Paraglaciecola aquimarina]|uniref:Transcriptional regulator n=1 Tax=Paraglaciecola aquimarina TaxID=1235557 RepID=A0ABU3T0W3_9ALTE|nr:hypothetical protein [Paraglaciecola aquimarina]MDU0355896.1 hypothetical protein [Paraglaciecola aquimarina]